MAENVLRAVQGDTLDALLWRERRIGPASLGAVLDANRGLSDLGTILPMGTPVALPPAAPVADVLPLIQLWD